MTIHATDPFPAERSPLRRLRGRLPAAVTLWTTYGRDNRPAGLTVSSTLVAEGDPGRLLGLIDAESELYPALRHSERFAVIALHDGDAQLADRFAGTLPAPGGLFAQEEWEGTRFGPVPPGHTWVGCLLASARTVGYAELVEATVEQIVLASDGPPLVRHRGRYARFTLS